MNEPDIQHQIEAMTAGSGICRHLPIDRRRPIEMQDSLDDLRMVIKYLVYDLEATRRENVTLRRMIEQAADQHEDDDE